IYKKYPWVAFNLYTGFVKAKEHFNAKLVDSIPSGLFFGREYLAMTQGLFGNDPYPYGVKANRKMLETLIDFSHEQGLTSKKMKGEELFGVSALVWKKVGLENRSNGLLERYWEKHLATSPPFFDRFSLPNPRARHARAPPLQAPPVGQHPAD